MRDSIIFVRQRFIIFTILSSFMIDCNRLIVIYGGLEGRFFLIDGHVIVEFYGSMYSLNLKI